ncbi:hypothetical protein HDU77_010667 [Chytriomyces hyalinus]|nr:hypothetical protein HDU77_010667 [Chytriomyces hyalinus]
MDALPHEIIVLTLSWIHPTNLLLLRVLSSKFNALISTRSCIAATLLRFVPRNKTDSKLYWTEFDLLFFSWPPLFQSVYAECILKKFTRIDWAAAPSSDLLLMKPIPPALGILHNLKDLDLSEAGISGQFPIELTRLPLLEALCLALNCLHGPIPPEISQLTKLEHLNLACNNFTGPLDPIYALKSIKTLIVRVNSLSGTLSPEISNLTSLIHLDLSHNNFHGFIPLEIKGCKASLQVLYLRGNNFGGSIPQSLFECSLLRRLDLSENELEGVVCGQSVLNLVELREFIVMKGNLLERPLPWMELSLLEHLIEIE